MRGLVTSIRALAGAQQPDSSDVGSVRVALTRRGDRDLPGGRQATRSARGLADAVLTAEAKVTLIVALFAAAVLLGLLANAWLDRDSADPAAA